MSFLNSCHLSAWWCIDFVWRNKKLIVGFSALSFYFALKGNQISDLTIY